MNKEELTRDKVLSMPSGTEMDTLVAEMVMGWHKGGFVSWTGMRTARNDEDWLDADGRYMCGVPQEDMYEDDEDFNLLHWHPSQSIIWAWQVVEKLEERGWYFEVRNNPPDVGFSIDIRDKEHGTWDMNGNYDDWIEADARGESVPHAICRAALLAMLEEIRCDSNQKELDSH